jgi:hypothetical protein
VAAEDVSLCQSLTEAVDVVEFGHFHVGMADLSGGVGVAAGALQQPMLCGEGEGLAIGVAETHGARIEDLEDVDLREKPRYLTETTIIDASHAVEGVRETDEPVLSLDPSEGLVNGDVARDRLREEHAHDFSQRRQYLFGYNHPEGGDLLDSLGTLYSSVVGNSDAVDADLLTAPDDRLRSRGAVERVLGVHVEVSLQHGRMPRVTDTRWTGLGLLHISGISQCESAEAR